MKLYSGDEQKYLTNIFRNDSDLVDILYDYSIYNLDGAAALLATATADNTNSTMLDSMISASSVYQDAIENYANEVSDAYTTLLKAYQDVLQELTSSVYLWYMDENKDLYMGILKSLIYGSLKHFFYENRHKYLPQYDWYLIEKDDNRERFVNALYREFDKLSTAIDSIKNFTDIDEIPDDFLGYLMELIGTTVNDYGGVLTDEKIRNLAKHLIEVYRYKGSLFAFELFFAAIGIDAQVNELYFDRRRYYAGVQNEYTLADSIGMFEYYLTPYNPVTINYPYYADTNPKFRDMTYPISVSVWDKALSNIDSYSITTDTTYQDGKDYYKYHGGSYIKLIEGVDYDPGDTITGTIYEYNDVTESAIKTLLGFENTYSIPVDERFTYFKSNLVSIKYYRYARSNDMDISNDEFKVYKSLTQQIIPAFIKMIFTNIFSTSNEEGEWFIIYSNTIVDSNEYNKTGAGMVSSGTLLWIEPDDDKATSDIIKDLFAATHDEILISNLALNASVESSLNDFTIEDKSSKTPFKFSTPAPHLYETASYINNVTMKKTATTVSFTLNDWADDNTFCSVHSELTNPVKMTISNVATLKRKNK